MGRVMRGAGAPQLWSKLLCGAVLAVGLASAALPEDALIVPGTLPLDTDGNPVGPHNKLSCIPSHLNVFLSL